MLYCPRDNVSLWVIPQPKPHAAAHRCQSGCHQGLGVGLLVTKNHSETEELLFPTAMKANGESKANFKAPNMKEVQQLENKAQTWPGPGVLHTNN